MPNAVILFAFGNALSLQTAFSSMLIVEGVAHVPLVKEWISHPTDTIKAAPCSFSNKGDAFSRFSGLPFFGRSIMISDRGHRNPPHHGASLPRTKSLGVCLRQNL